MLKTTIQQLIVKADVDMPTHTPNEIISIQTHEINMLYPSEHIFHLEIDCQLGERFLYQHYLQNPPFQHQLIGRQR